MPDYGPAIEAVEAFVPRQSVAVEAAAPRLGISRNQVKVLQRVHGLAQVRWDPGLALLDMISIPAEAVLATVPGTSRIRYLVYAHTAPDVAPAGVSTAQVLRHRLGLAHAEAFAVTQQACASGLAAIDLAAQLLLADGDPAARALVVTGEKPATRFLSLIPGASVMGDGSAACLVNISGEGMRIRSFSSRTDGRHAQLMNPPPGAVTGFYATYAPTVAAAVRETVAGAGLKLADIEMIVPHNVNLSSWQRVISELGIPAGRVYLDNVPRYGHCFSSDVLLNLASMRAQGKLSQDGAYLLVAVGLGAVYAAMVIGG